MKLARRIGQVSGLILANLFSPYMMLLGAVAGPHLEHFKTALASKEGFAQEYLQLQQLMQAHPLETMSLMLAFIIVSLSVSTAYTLWMAKTGGHIAEWLTGTFFKTQPKVLLAE